MRDLRLLICYLAVTAFFFLAGYELPAKSHEAFGQALPGWQTAAYVEGITPWNPRSGIVLIDRLSHEVEEAASYYRLLLAETAARPFFAVLQPLQ